MKTFDNDPLSQFISSRLGRAMAMGRALEVQRVIDKSIRMAKSINTPRHLSQGGSGVGLGILPPTEFGPKRKSENG